MIRNMRLSQWRHCNCIYQDGIKYSKTQIWCDTSLKKYISTGIVSEGSMLDFWLNRFYFKGIDEICLKILINLFALIRSILVWIRHTVYFPKHMYILVWKRYHWKHIPRKMVWKSYISIKVPKHIRNGAKKILKGATAYGPNFGARTLYIIT